MNTFRDILNKEFTSLMNIIIKEDSHIYNLTDCIILKGDNSKFQIFTNQMGVFVIDLNKEELLIEGEYEIEELIYNEIKKFDLIIIISAKIIWDINKNYILGFILSSAQKSFYFIRLVDEIEFVEKEKFDFILSKIKYYIQDEN